MTIPMRGWLHYCTTEQENHSSATKLWTALSMLGLIALVWGDRGSTARGATRNELVPWEKMQ